MTEPGTGTTPSGTPSIAPSRPGAGSSLWLFDNAKATRTTQLLLSVEKPYVSESGWSASFAYTYSDAEERLEFNGDYQVDYAFSYYAPYVRSGEVPKHRLVAVGSYDVPWGITLGAKMVVETPKPFSCICHLDANYPPPNGLNYNFVRTAPTPDDTIGYFTLDLQVTKTFEFGNGSAVQLRFDVLNVTNHENFASYLNLDPERPKYDKVGDIAGVPRTLQAEHEPAVLAKAARQCRGARWTGPAFQARCRKAGPFGGHSGDAPASRWPHSARR